MIPSIILEEAKHFVTFMSSMVEELIGNEDLMMAILRNSNKTAEISEYLNHTLANETAVIVEQTEEDSGDKVF